MKFRIVGIGEVLWDQLPSGPQLGGAPGNFAHHARELGAESCVITRVGDDALGRAALKRFEERGITHTAVQVDDEAPTGTVTVSLSPDGSPTYVIHEGVAWDRLAVTTAGIHAVRGADAICFGSLAQRSETSRRSIQELVAATSPDALRVFDMNLRQQYFSRGVVEQSLNLANVLKLNDGELPVLAGMFGLTGTARQQIDWLTRRFHLRLVALTCGAEGSVLCRSGQWSEDTSAPVEVVDTVGAGDAFTAALVLGELQGMELADMHRLAGEVARYVCSCAGATPVLPQSLRRGLR